MRKFLLESQQEYSKYGFRTIANNFIQFLQNPLSLFYVVYLILN